MTEHRDNWRKYVHIVWPNLGSRTAKEQNRTELYASGTNITLYRVIYLLMIVVTKL